MTNVARFCAIRILRNNLLDAEALVDDARAALEAAGERLREASAQRDDLARELAEALEAAA